MATDQNVLNFPTLGTIMANYSSTDANSMWLEAARVLDRECPLLRMLPMYPTNNTLFNVASRTNYIPAPSWRDFNMGVPVTTSQNVPLTDPVALLEAYSQVDKEECNIQNDPMAWRRDQDLNHIEGFVQTLETALFYGNIGVNPGGFNGLATRFNNLESYPNGDTSWQPNCWNGGLTSGNSTSIWLLEMSKKGLYGIYPKNTRAGLMVENLGEQTVQYPTSISGGPMQPGRMQAYVSHFTWWIGIQVADERCVQRIANINPTILASNDFDENIIIAAKNQLPNYGKNAVMIVNRSMKTQIDIRAVSQKINAYTNFSADRPSNVFGTPVTEFQGMPIIVSEEILNTETVLT